MNARGVSAPRLSTLEERVARLEAALNACNCVGGGGGGGNDGDGDGDAGGGGGGEGGGGEGSSSEGGREEL